MAPNQVSVVSDQAVTMRDGTVLYADVHLPAGLGPFPALLERTPYSKDNSPEVQVGAPALLAARGYGVVIQDVRGRFKSEGEFVPFRDDGWGANRDGLETVKWMAAQPGCNGAVSRIVLPSVD
jgi:putative CocE/NonD family hydrolase